ncbi:restriction endonuclease [Pseudomonas entomophila]|uniref:restriction endonuclease n=1 Tax=Pseudomonas entomophila TaxID=312306 RepID=UPI00200E8AFE|nr:restriction endonuclease [Pseudomonas entomophila]
MSKHESICLDFTEIPPSRPPSSDVSAFEKFAREFFVTLFDAQVIKTVGRGADNGADLVLKVGDERWLVSCKHYQGGSVPRSVETSPLGDMQQWGCQRFIGFYLPEASDGLVTRLRQTEENCPEFRHEIFDNRVIERHLISSTSADGWLLAKRWFPRSYAKISRSLVYPITHYNHGDIISEPGSTRIEGIPTRIWFNQDNPVAAQEAAQALIAHANELETGRAYSSLFLEHIRNFALMCPGAFLRYSGTEDKDVNIRGLAPSWDMALVRRLCLGQNRHALENLCLVWSMWGHGLACRVYRFARYWLDGDIDAQQALGVMYVEELEALLVAFEQDELIKPKARRLDHDLSFAHVAACGQTLERGYYAALMCFSPGKLYGHLSRERALVRSAIRHGEQDLLQSAIWAVAQTYEMSDWHYIVQKSPTLEELLVSINVIDHDYLTHARAQAAGLRCLSEPLLSVWEPEGSVDRQLAMALGFMPDQD